MEYNDIAYRASTKPNEKFPKGSERFALDGHQDQQRLRCYRDDQVGFVSTELKRAFVGFKLV